MKIRVALLPQLLSPNWNSSPTIAIVIDTLRFTTTACQALSNGASHVHIAGDVQEAKSIAAKDPLNSRSASRVLLCGERHCRPIEGFDLGNSPYEYTRERIADRHLVFTTTNGTRAISAVQAAQQIWLAANVNRRAVCHALGESNADTAWIVCAGTDGEVAVEDMLTAGAILELTQARVVGDAAHLVLAAWRDVLRTGEARSDLNAELTQRFQQASGGRNLVQSGYTKDLDFAAQFDTIASVPKNGEHWNVFAN